MMIKEDKRFMRKEFVYALFILKFFLGIGLIWWTISMTLSSDVGKDDDNAFLSNYHDVDRDYNKMIKQNNAFEAKYNVKFLFNDEEIIGLTYQDVFLSQRAIQARKTRKDIVKIGQNKFSVLVQTKDGKTITNKNVEILLTKNTTHEHDVKLTYTNEDIKEFPIDSIGYWNITGTISVGDNKGFFYLKTNAKRN